MINIKSLLLDAIVNYVLDLYNLTPEQKMLVLGSLHATVRISCYYLGVFKSYIKENERFIKWIHSKLEKGCSLCNN
ncbi:hypothetical protein J2T04_002992 [Chryseobacterium lathyri]|uniref:Uncharacterized protein n=1 Tax=Chryseobacterium lathyri TaxID=395933 RepID=A0ABT9SNS0_9FLAO|nr:hypothetical protein [Chryseobacterium lathyri]